MKGKAYANRKKESERPKSDFYQTPYCLTWELIKLNEFDISKTIYEPACGKGAISSQLKNAGYSVLENDLNTTGKNFLNCKDHYDYIITNPPFSLFDDFVLKAKECSDKFAMIMKTNFFGAYKRNLNGVWKNLNKVYIFNRQIDYQNEPDVFSCGNLITAWGIWDKNWNENYHETRIIDIQGYFK